MKPSQEELKQAISRKSDSELYDMLHVHSSDYTADALEIARGEFVTRKMEAPALSDLAAAGAKLRRNEEAPLEWGLRMVAFFVSTAFLGIPVLLAHRRYVEQGAKRKARDWARWALFGFIFYFALSISTLLLPSVFR
jgi:hypothetical protein